MNIDLIAMLGNLSLSLYPVQHFITGGAYLLGIVFFIVGIAKIKKVASSRSQEKSYSSFIYFLIGSALLYLPYALKTLANTAFGSENVLTYTPIMHQFTVYDSMILLIRTAGLLWFVRGCVLLTYASQPGAKAGSKGLAFVAAGILAMNITNTVSMLGTLLSYFMKLTSTTKPS